MSSIPSGQDLRGTTAMFGVNLKLDLQSGEEMADFGTLVRLGHDSHQGPWRKPLSSGGGGAAPGIPSAGCPSLGSVEAPSFPLLLERGRRAAAAVGGEDVHFDEPLPGDLSPGGALPTGEGLVSADARIEGGARREGRAGGA